MEIRASGQSRPLAEAIAALTVVIPWKTGQVVRDALDVIRAATGSCNPLEIRASGQSLEGQMIVMNDKS